MKSHRAERTFKRSNVAEGLVKGFGIYRTNMKISNYIKQNRNTSRHPTVRKELFLRAAYSIIVHCGSFSTFLQDLILSTAGDRNTGTDI